MDLHEYVALVICLDRYYDDLLAARELGSAPPTGYPSIIWPPIYRWYPTDLFLL